MSLILHVGDGKTGSTSIQDTLRLQRDHLRKQGVWYLGLALEYAPVQKYSWQRQDGTSELLALEKQVAVAQLVDVLRGSISLIRKANGCKMIWSNEAFLGQREAAIDAASALASDTVSLQVVAYVRRHDAWIRSAYLQWGIKHKTYTGRLQPFRTWLESNRPRLNYATRMRPWVNEFGDRLTIRNMDAAGDVVSDFLQIAGIDDIGLEVKRNDNSPSPEELVLRALFNETFDEKVPLTRFSKLLTDNRVSFDRSISTYLNGILPSASDLESVRRDCVGDRRYVNELLKANGQPLLEDGPLPQRATVPNTEKVVASMFQMMVQQARRIENLEQAVRKGITFGGGRSMSDETEGKASVPSVDSDMELDAPVFAISTGRSGSTLVQRLLNCHRDLVMWGEHHGFLNGIAAAYAQMRAPERKEFPKTAAESKGPAQLLPTMQDPAAAIEWANPWCLPEAETKFRDFIRDYFGARLADGQRWGFKEIRYNNPATLNMLRSLFPLGKFVFIRRDPIEVARSKVFAFVKESKWNELNDKQRRNRVAAMLDEVYAHYSEYDRFMKAQPGAGVIVDYEELVASPREVIERLLTHTGLKADRFDWGLADQVCASIITRTKRDDEVVGLIRDVDRERSAKNLAV